MSFQENAVPEQLLQDFKRKFSSSENTVAAQTKEPEFAKLRAAFLKYQVSNCFHCTLNPL